MLINLRLYIVNGGNVNMTKENGFPDEYINKRIPILSSSDLLDDLICFAGTYELLASRSKGNISDERKQVCKQDMEYHNRIFDAIKKELLRRERV